MPLIHPFTHTFTHQRRLAAMQGTNQLVRSNWGLGVLLRDTSTRPGWDRTGNPPTARRQLLPPEPHRPCLLLGSLLLSCCISLGCFNVGFLCIFEFLNVELCIVALLLCVVEALKGLNVLFPV